PIGRTVNVGAGMRLIRSQFAAAFHRLLHRDFVGVFDVAAGGDTGSDARDLHRGGSRSAVAARRFVLLFHLLLGLLYQPRDVHGGGLAFDRRISGDNDFVDFAGIYPAREIAEPQVLRPNAVERRKRTVQHVIDAVVVACLLDGRDVGRFLHHTNQPLVAGGAAAVDAGIDVGDVVALRAQVQLGFDVADGAG